MKINKKLAIELLQNELIYTRRELKTAIGDLDIEQKVGESIKDNLNRVIQEKCKMQQQKEELQKRVEELAAGIAAPAGEETRKSEFRKAQYETRIAHLEEIIFELGDELEETTNQLLDAVETAEERAELLLEFGDDLEKTQAENDAYKKAIKALKEEASAGWDDCKPAGGNPTADGKGTEPAPAGPEEEPEEEISDGKDILISIKNRLCNKNYKVQNTGKALIANKPGTRRIEVQHAELPGSAKYIVCGTTYYEFDKALKASAHGTKYANRLSEEDLNGIKEEGGAA
jgi:hypothetical protein